MKVFSLNSVHSITMEKAITSNLVHTAENFGIAEHLKDTVYIRNST